MCCLAVTLTEDAKVDRYRVYMNTKILAPLPYFPVVVCVRLRSRASTKISFVRSCLLSRFTFYLKPLPGRGQYEEYDTAECALASSCYSRVR